ncbi:MAG: benzoate transporter BenE [Proteobacteria bacterium]|nr:MAG: benzoate transporter BenE [Pseudomonadota bacterium]
MIQQIRRDFTLQATIAGLVVVLVGMTSGAALIFQAARAYGLSADGASSWLGAICIGIALTTIPLTLKYRSPVVTAWSTAGAALIAAGAVDYSLGEAIGAFLVSAALVTLSGLTGGFEKVMSRIPVSIAAALLAGVLLHFSLDSFNASKSQPLLIGAMFLAYLLAKRFAARYTMLIVLVFGTLLAWSLGLLKFGDIHFSWTQFVFSKPEFTLKATLGLALPLFVVTMVSQNLTGISVMRANAFQTPASPILTWTGLVNIVLAPIGGFSVCLAAITAAIAVGPESHPDRSKRYIASLVSGVVYLLIGFVCGTVASIFAAFPSELVLGILGLALLTTIGNSLQTALSDERNKEAAFITFAVTASGVSLLGVSSAFWGVIAGGLTKVIFDFKTRS